jgi:hypothetical protein
LTQPFGGQSGTLEIGAGQNGEKLLAAEAADFGQ